MRWLSRYTYDSALAKHYNMFDVACSAYNIYAVRAYNIYAVRAYYIFIIGYVACLHSTLSADNITSLRSFTNILAYEYPLNIAEYCTIGRSDLVLAPRPTNK